MTVETQKTIQPCFKKVLLVQLPIPQHNFGRQTGNIPLAAACLKSAADRIVDARIEIMPESLASYIGDAAMVQWIISRKPDVVGFTVYSWNIERSLFIASQIRQHHAVKVIFGGPEVTPDNPLLRTDMVDFCVSGEGEKAFINLLTDISYWKKVRTGEDYGGVFETAPSPYIDGLLEPEIEDMVLIESQRGCPYRCGFCYYNKSRRRGSFVQDARIFELVQWVLDHGFSEIFFLDPSLNARPGLSDMVHRLAAINGSKRVCFQSEIRAESIDRTLAERFSEAGFTEFEVGLQSTNPVALKLMNRPTDMKRFLAGVKNLQQAGIQPKIDLMIGLPGDDLNGFKTSVDFVAKNGIADDVQVFFLSVLPGTRFRRKSRQLGLKYGHRPPYTVIETPTFSENEMASALYYAEDRFGINLEPEPDLDISYRKKGIPIKSPVRSLRSNSESTGYVSRIFFDCEQPISIVQKLAHCLTQPYQIIFGQNIRSRQFMEKIIRIVTGTNPYTPLEIVLMHPNSPTLVPALDSAILLKRPLYLDLDIPALGTRSVIFTWVSESRDPVFGGICKRQVFWYKNNRVPERRDLENLDHLDGILFDNTAPMSTWEKWQDDVKASAGDLLPVSFADIELQYRWMKMVNSEGYWLKAFA